MRPARSRSTAGSLKGTHFLVPVGSCLRQHDRTIGEMDVEVAVRAGDGSRSFARTTFLPAYLARHELRAEWHPVVVRVTVEVIAHQDDATMFVGQFRIDLINFFNINLIAARGNLFQ